MGKSDKHRNIAYTEVMNMATRKYKVVNISPRLTDEERREVMQRIGPALLSALGSKEAPADYKPKKPKETPLEELGDSMAEKMAKEFIRTHPNYIVSVMD